MKLINYLFILFLSQNTLAQGTVNEKKGIGTVKFVFRNLINGQPVVLFDSTYKNPFGESFELNKLKYYASNIALATPNNSSIVTSNYYLINQQIDSSLSFSINFLPGKYEAVEFLLGVDSIANESGAQTGALDPLNDMFWTWQSGYVMIKLEGTSPQSKAANNKIEYHLGGYKGINSVLQTVRLMAEFTVEERKTTTIVINANIDKFWNAITPLEISATALCNTPGALAKQIAANFRQVFSIAEVIHEK